MKNNIDTNPMSSDDKITVGWSTHQKIVEKYQTCLEILYPYYAIASRAMGEIPLPWFDFESWVKDTADKYLEDKKKWEGQIKKTSK